MGGGASRLRQRTFTARTRRGSEMETKPREKLWNDRIEDQITTQEGLRRTGKIVARASELVWGEGKMARNSLAISPMTGYAIHTMHAHIDEMNPGAQSGLHRHSSEAVMLVLAGAGYTTVD